MPRPRFESLAPDRRRAILAAAVDEIAARGLAAASTNRIIERAGLSKGALYYYFDDKADLCRAALEDAVERIAAEIGPPTPFDDAHGFWASLGEVYERAIGAVQREPRLIGLLRALVTHRSPDLDEALAAVTADLIAGLTGFLAQGVAVGAVRDDMPPALLARLLAALGDAGDVWLLEHLEETTPDDLARYPREALELHLRVAAPAAFLRERLHPGAPR